uniref:Uncharacterized protein n=1 Tax=Oryza punctata TaxID=4537 RepID=A0A0E0LJT0_ORYPU
MQLYFYDTEDADALAHRVRRFPDVDINLVRVILGILVQNPYVQTFNRVRSMPNLDDYRIELNTNTGWNLKMPYEDPNQIPCDVEMDETCEASTFASVRTNEENTFDDLLGTYTRDFCRIISKVYALCIVYVY